VSGTTGEREDAVAELRRAVGFAVSSPARLLTTGTVAVVAYVVMVLSSFPGYSAQMLGAGVGYLDEAVVDLSENVLATGGPRTLGLLVVYALLTGVTTTVVVARVRVAGVNWRSVSDVAGVAPGLAAAGCAGCGAGLLGLVGFAGALSAMPLHGDSLRIGGIALLVFALVRTGDPRSCDV
jgi:hypothetical protein